MGIKKSLMLRTRLFFYLAQRCDVASLRSLWSLFNIELDSLSLLQVAESITLNGGEMNENVLSTFTFDKAEAFDTVKPFDRTSYSFRHCICLLRAVIKFRQLFVPSEGKTKQPTNSNCELSLSSNQRNLPLSYKGNSNRQTLISQSIWRVIFRIATHRLPSEQTLSSFISIVSLIIFKL